MSSNPKLPTLKTKNLISALIRRIDLIARQKDGILEQGLYEVYDAANPIVILAASSSDYSYIGWRKGSPADLYIYDPALDSSTPYTTQSIVKLPARAGSTGNYDLSAAWAGGAFDGVNLVATNRMFLKDQTDKKENGIYVCNGVGQLLTRATDFDAAANVKSSTVVIVTEGTVNADTTWELITNDPIVIGTTELDFIPTSFDVLTKTKAQVSSLKTGSKLQRGQIIYISDLAEPLIVSATDVNKIDIVAKSPSFPQDIIYYDTSDANPANWAITYRHDTLKNLSTWYDWRTIKFTRWETVAGNGTYTATSDPGGGAASQEFYTFNNNINPATNTFVPAADGNGGSCLDISIDKNCTNNIFGTASTSFELPGYSCTDNTIGNNFRLNIIGHSFQLNVIGINCIGNTFDFGFTQNVIGTNFQNNFIGNNMASSYTFGNGITQKRLENGFSNFEATIDTLVGADIDLLTVNAHVGIFNIITSSIPFNETVDNLLNAPTNHPFEIRVQPNLTIDFRDKSVAAGNLSLENTPTSLDGDKYDVAKFRNIGGINYLENIKNYI